VIGYLVGHCTHSNKKIHFMQVKEDYRISSGQQGRQIRDEDRERITQIRDEVHKMNNMKK
jgi:hypothetical protein